MGTLVALTLYLTRLYGPLTSLSNVQVDVMTALVSFDRVFEVLDLPPMIDDKAGGGCRRARAGPGRLRPRRLPLPPPGRGLARLARGRRGPRERAAASRSSSTFPSSPSQASCVALVGPSGAGKTTISHLAARLYDVTGARSGSTATDVRDVTLSSLQDGGGRRYPGRPPFP